MAFDKKASNITISTNMKITPLNNPKGWEIFELPKVVKTASIKKDEDLGGYDIHAAIEKHPEHLFVKIFAIKENEVNDNGDMFSAKELKKAAHTFVGVPIFTNHQNDDIEKARGECVHSWYDKDAGGIFIVARVDKVAYPTLARAISEGYAKGTSMGCSVDRSCCSICHNLSSTADEYCSHIKNSKNRKKSGTFACKYHESPDRPQDDCPVCGCKLGEKKEHVLKEGQVFEWNYGLKFIENSFVVNPACHECGVECVLHVPELNKKVASLKKSVEKLEKAAAKNQTIKDSKSKDYGKIAGAVELEMLKDALNKIEKVAKSMMTQKNYVDMEYVSDLVKAMADVQGTIDELQEMGYSQVPTPPDVTSSDPSVDVSSMAFPDPAQQPQQMQPTQPVPQPASNPATSRSDLGGGLGSVTKPKGASILLDKKKEFIRISHNINDRLASLCNLTTKLAQECGSNDMADTFIHVWENQDDINSRHVIIDEEYVTEAQGSEILRVSKISTLDEETQGLISDNPQKVAEQILSKITKESSTSMSDKNKKTAALGTDDTDDSSQGEYITEKQLQNNAPTLHPRTDETYEQITESDEQLGRSDDKSNDTSSESPQKRSGTYETITEDQLASIASGHIVRMEDAPEVITEKQWDDMSRLVSGKLPSDWTETITQDQLRNLLDSHSTAGTYETITEDQLANRLGGIKRWANAGYVRHLAKIASEVISDVVANFGKTTEEISEAVAQINDDSEMKSKVAYLTVVNSLPRKAASRKDFMNKASSFKNRKASSEQVDVLDAMIVSSASRAGLGVKAEDIYEAMSHVFRKKTAMSHVDSLVQEKLASSKKENVLVDKFAALDNAFDAMDGVLIKATLGEIGVDHNDKPKFVAACKKYAQDMMMDQGLGEGMTILEIKLDPETGILTIEAGEGSEADDFDLMGEMEGDVAEIGHEDSMEEDIHDEFGGVEEDKDMGCGCGVSKDNGMAIANKETGTKEARASKRDSLKKEAQMAGGEMGGQGGASQMPGAGASMPQSPALDAAPMESFDAPTMEEGLDDSGDLKAKPPGSVCPVCTSEDVDIVAGSGKCNNCGSEMTYKVSIEVNKWSDLLGDQDNGSNEEEELGLEGEGFDLPVDEGMGMPVGASSKKIQKIASKGMPFALTMKLNPEAIKKASEAGVSFGSVSPITGSTNTHKIASNKFVCLDSGCVYDVEVAVPAKGGKAYAQWSWNIKSAEVCPSCSRQKKAFVNALNKAGLTEDKFDNMTIAEKAEAILELKKAGALNMTKVASKSGSVVEDYKLAYGVYGDQFPIESCHEKLARRYGKNSLALSGPCEGQPIHECVCSKLKSAGVYTDGLAIKVAEAWSDRDGTEECIEDQVRCGLDIRSAATVCSALKTALAADEDFLADDLGSDDLGGLDSNDDMDMGLDSNDDADMGLDIDPFEGDGEGTVTLELSEELAKELDAALDVQLGSDPMDDLDTPGEVGDLDLVGDAPEIGNEVPGDEGPMDEGMVEETDLEPMMESPMAPMAPKPMMGHDDCPCVEEKEEGILGDNRVKDHEDLKLEIGRLASDESGEDTLDDSAHMKSSFNQTGKVSLDLNSVAKALGMTKEADEKSVVVEKAQDSKDIGNYSDGDPMGGELPGAMHHEKDSVPTASHPDVPRNDARMGHEDESLKPGLKLPSIPSDKGTMGHEDEVGLEGGDVRMTGGLDGAGETEASSENELVKEAELERELGRMKGVVGNSKDRTDSLVDRLNRILQAGKLDKSEPVADDADVKPHSTGKGIGHEENFSADEPTNTEGSGNESMMGHEKESLGDTPKSPADHPEVPEDNQLMGHEDGDEVGPEKQLKNKGTVIARNDKESVQKEASTDSFRVAGRMLAEGMIEASQLQSKIEELSKYQPNQVRDLEKAMFSKKAVSAKGLTTASEGIEQALVIPESASQRNSQTDLTNQLMDLFSLGKQNNHAQSLPDFDTRRLFKK